MLAYMLLSIFGGIVLVFIIFDPKAIPGLWHARIIAILLNHLVWKRSQPSLSSDGPSALFRPLRTRSYCSITEVDFNLHKSNSTFYADLDISRIELLLSLFKDVITPLSPPAREGGTAESAEKDGRRKLKHLTPALGGVSCIFRREIKPWQRYDLVSRVLCWDDKWLYIVSHFLKPSDHNGASLAASEDQIFASATSKYIGYAGLAVLQLTLMGLWASPSGQTTTRATIGTTVVSWLASVVFGVLSHYEHFRTIRPATINSGYLFLSSILSLPETRTLYYVETHRSIPILYTMVLCLKLMLLVIETISKVSILKKEYRDSPPESTVGILGECLFWWLNPLLLLGNQMDLTVSQLPAIEESIRSTGVGQNELEELWKKGSSKSSDHSLLFACFRYCLGPIVLGILPRALQVAFTFAQPFLVEATVTWVSASDLSHPKGEGYALIGAFGIVYSAIAVSTAVSQHQAYRVVSMLRASLIDILYSRVLVMRDLDVETSTPVTLMSADMERISSGLRYIHDSWACAVEIPIALYLLWQQLGVASIAPIVVVIVCMALSVLISTLAGPRQKLWLEAIENRVGVTAKVLGSMKGVRTSGLTDKLFNLVQTMRVEEVAQSERFRRLLILVVGVAYSNVTLSPLASFIIYSLIARHKGDETLTPAKAFTSLTLFTLLATPIAHLVEAATGVATAIGSIKRINRFLLSEPRHDDTQEDRCVRRNTSIPVSIPSSTLTLVGTIYDEKATSSRMNRISTISTVSSISSHETLTPYDESIGPVFMAKGRSAGWEESKPAVVEDLNFEIPRGTVTIVVGPVGCGKSTFVRTLLRETPIYSGGLKADPEAIAYCSQAPWLTNRSIQDNILGESLFNLRWYNTVIDACALYEDIRAQPNRDQTLLGTQGAVLSGGQKQRVALARAVYSKADTMILDDVFSGLDRSTEDAIFHALLGPEGLLRKMGTTVIMTTNSPIWVEKWTASNAKHPNSQLGYWLGIYGAIAVMAVSTLVLACCAPMSFFHTTDLGTTTNRFSQDLQLIDMELPLSVLNTILTFFTCVAQIVVVCVATNYIAATIPACLIAFYFIQRFYLRTSRQMRYLDIEAKAPLVSHFLETLSGLSTIRSYNWEQHYRRRNSELLNESQKPFYLLYAIQRWLELVIALMVAGFAVVLVGVAVATRGKLSASFIGLALLNVVTFTENLQGLVKQWTVLETSIGAVSRIRNFKATIDSEHLEFETFVPPPDWPARGSIEFTEVVAAYKNASSRALDHISLSIKAGTKIGICGRSGSGKSSLISSLFRLIELASGAITIDGLDITTLTRNSLRAQLNCIPQEPFLLPGCSVRLNIDPGAGIHDDILTDALKKVQMWGAVQELGGLDATITADTFSPGQRQLLCFARAMVRTEGKILVLDEATSSIDTKTDEIMQSLIRTEFANHTVIAIAHRLETIVDFDEVVVIDAGRVKERGPPAELLEKKGAFAELYWDKNRGSSRTPLALEIR
ncbi:uncharacterized protein BDW43DRAFT_321569 [Aspergillus alliaceus]|uniref:uncharacterized protein n=1 Tax=Petromyces alliaceus TaxID=209559 RepID=UPI0012A465AA|nr:uncharacterized protein BDW43DRAFT_321569 [Aspergillus alliaceus]KAB8230272.1 hypothetical protein BDW43DRAFT_321569 [Aspergillus alliaceus]